MGPEPECGVAAYGFFEESEVTDGHGVVGFVGVGGNGHEGEASVATACFFEVDVVVCGVDALADYFASGGVSGRESEEGGPVVEVAVRSLVGDEAGTGNFSGAVLANEV